MAEELKSDSAPVPRRDFVKEVLAITFGTLGVLVPVGAGVAMLSDPLRRRAAAGAKIRVASIDALPKDGTPRKFPIIASRVDAWNKYPDAPVGAVYLRRAGENKVEALNVVCPHAGCFIDFRDNTKKFFCPCHNSSFELSGKISDASSPSPRGMDTLDVELKGNEVWVQFQNFRTGQREKVPMA